MGYVKTAAEVSSDNSALMRNIRKNENALQGALMDVSRAVMACGRFMGVGLPEKGDVGGVGDDELRYAVVLDGRRIEEPFLRKPLPGGVDRLLKKRKLRARDIMILNATESGKTVVMMKEAKK